MRVPDVDPRILRGESLLLAFRTSKFPLRTPSPPLPSSEKPCAEAPWVVLLCIHLPRLSAELSRVTAQQLKANMPQVELLSFFKPNWILNSGPSYFSY